MSRERFEELKARAEGHIKRKDANALELQKTITDSAAMIAQYEQQKEQAEADNDPEAYAQACTLVNMYTDKKRKAEAEQGRGEWAAAIPLDLYEEIRAFLQLETEQCAHDEMTEIKALLQEADAIIQRADAYHLELSTFAQECERVCRASYTGEYRHLTVGSMPPALAEDVKTALYSFNSMTH